MTSRSESKSQADDTRNLVPGLFVWWAEASYTLRRYAGTVRDSIAQIGVWDKGIKELEGKHGAAVGAYFTFLRWCLYLNLFIALVYVGFVIIPVRTTLLSQHSHRIAVLGGPQHEG